MPPAVTIFVVEDNPGDVLLLRKALEHHSVKVDLLIAQDGDEAIRLLERIEAAELPSPDLLLCDLNLPKRDGFHVLRRARHSPKCLQSPVVILTSSDSASDREAAAGLGVSCYLLKPMELDSYLSIGGTLKELLTKRRPIAGDGQPSTPALPG